MFSFLSSRVDDNDKYEDAVDVMAVVWDRNDAADADAVDADG